MLLTCSPSRLIAISHKYTILTNLDEFDSLFNNNFQIWHCSVYLQGYMAQTTIRHPSFVLK